MQTPSLPIMETFYSLQGEGYHQGKAAYFIRLAGCNVGCSWCDVKESWNEAQHPLLPIDGLVNQAKQHPSKIVIITGGEPCLYDLSILTESLHLAGLQTHLETSGSAPITGVWDWICLSPKKFKAPLLENLSKAQELKVIAVNQNDFLWATQYANQVQPSCKLFIQPEWEKAATITPSVIRFIQQNPNWQLSLQIHKYVHIA